MNQNLNDLNSETVALRAQLLEKEKTFDDAMRNDVEFARAKTLFHEIKIISARLDEIAAMVKASPDT